MRLEEGMQPRQHAGDVGQELQALAAQHGVEAGPFERQRLGVALDEPEVVESGRSGALAADRQHLGRDVGADDVPAGGDRAGGGQAGSP
jgi:hypothetical protein